MERPFPAYRGDKPYTFVCYAHDDAEIVYPELASLNEGGLRLWYDEGISPGTNWRAELGVSLLAAERVLFYISARSLASHHCNREINLALDEGKEILPVYLEDVELTPDMKVGLARVQALTQEASEDYRQRLESALQAAPGGRPRKAATPARKRLRPLVAAAATVVIAVAMATVWYLGRPPLTDPFALTMTVAVRPFTTIGDDPALTRHAALATDDVRNQLAAADLNLVAPDAPADYTLTGRVRAAASGSRVSFELTRTADGYVAWSENIDDPASPAPLTEFRRAPFVARMVEATLGMTNLRRFLENLGVTDSEEALDALIAGLTEVERTLLNADGDWGIAVQHFERAIQLDPEFALAYEALASQYVSRLGATLSAAEASAEAHRLLEKAVALGRDASFTQANLAFELDLDFAAAATYLDAAQGNQPIGVYEFAACRFAFYKGDFNEAIEHCRRSATAGSQAAQAASQFQLGLITYHAGRFEEARTAVELASATAGVGPGTWIDLVNLSTKALIEAKVGDVEAANATLDDALDLTEDFRDQLAAPLALVGRTEAARAILAHVARGVHERTRRRIEYGTLFWGYFFLGELDEAFVWLPRAVDNRETFITGAMHSSVILDPIRDDPRFVAALAQLAAIETRVPPAPAAGTAGPAAASAPAG